MTAAAPEAPVAAGIDVHAFLARERGCVNAALAAISDDAARGAPARLRDAVLYALETPGKRVRPILCVSAWRAVRASDDAPDAVYRLAAALEIVHTYSLVHDDLPCMDDDDLRRGRPTVHRVFGAPAATLAGAALVPVAVAVLDAAAVDLGLDAGRRRALAAALCRAGGAPGMVGGQLLDLEGEAREIDGRALEAIHRRKTGALLAASLTIGALAAGAGEDALAALGVYGESVGLAFQIVDDVLDVTASAEALGKTAGKDQSAAKSTYPALYGVEGARALAARCVDQAIDALREGGVRSGELEALARYVLERGR